MEVDGQLKRRMVIGPLVVLPGESQEEVVAAEVAHEADVVAWCQRQGAILARLPDDRLEITLQPLPGGVA